MQWFIHSSLIWAFLLALIPLLIHLINLMRHRRVKWAAMDFLLQSYKRRRQWIWLKQFLLLASRMAAVALIVAMLAKFQGCSDLASRFGGATTHHYVLLDDSFSMAERQGRELAFDRANRVVSQIATQAVAQTGRHKMTLLRFSKAAGAKGTSTAAADLEAELIDGRFDLLLEERRNAFDVTHLDVGPAPALDLAQRLAARSLGEKAIIYLVTDLRANQWDSPAEMREKMAALQSAGAEVRLINCIDQPEANLTVADLTPQDQTLAAGVPLFVDVKVKNNGATPARQVQAAVRTRFYPANAVDRSTPPGQWTPQTEELPTLLFEQIAPGEAATQRVQVYFPQPGRHVVEVELPTDALEPDNRRWLVIDLPEGERALLVDGSPEQGGAYYLASAFQPGARANTGIRTETQTPAFLRDAPLETLQQYASIYLIDVPQLDARAVDTLEKYVAAGGGLGIFVGPNVNVAAYNGSLYRNGEGLLPAPLDREGLLPPAAGDNTPDFEMADHPIFRPFLRVRNPVVRMVGIDRYLKVSADWAPDEQSGVTVVATLRDVRQPLALDRPFGAGRVVAFLTTISPQWNNWAHSLSFVPVTLSVQSHLASGKRQQPVRLAGEPLSATLEADRYAAEVSFVTPSGDPTQPVVIERTAQRAQGGSPLMSASLGEEDAVSAETSQPGVYEAWVRRLDGEIEVRRHAVNVEPEEGRLEQTARQTLLERLSPAAPKLQDWQDYQSETVARAESNWSEIILYLLIALLLGEQLLAFSASYHPAPQGAR